MTSALPDLQFMLHSCVRKEALLSSQIDGNQTSLSELLLYENGEAPCVPLEEVRSVSNYVAALNHGLKRMRGGQPFSLALIRELHGVLMTTEQGSIPQGGRFRRSQNWIAGIRGQASYVPPPPEYMMDCLRQLESFMQKDAKSLPILVQAGLLLAQFESIHPFLEGNGRIGRLLVLLMLCADNALREPVLYPSLFFKDRSRLYEERLNGTRKDENWTPWLDFFLQCVRDTANLVLQTAGRISQLFHGDKRTIENFGRGSSSALLVYNYAQANPIFSIKHAARATNLTFPTVSSSLERLIQAGILRETSGRRRDRVFVYDRYFDILN